MHVYELEVLIMPDQMQSSEIDSVNLDAERDECRRVEIERLTDLLITAYEDSMPITRYLTFKRIIHAWLDNLPWIAR